MPGLLTAGLEFSVNTQTIGGQNSPSIAAFDDGGFVVVWDSQDAAQDGSGSAIKAQRFDAAGNPVGLEFLVNNVATANQNSADVATFADGSFVVTWVSEETSIRSVKARVFDAGGAPIGPEFAVNPLAATRNDDPHVTVLDNGNFVVSWNESSGNDMKAQIFGSAGQAIGDAFLLNTSLTANQERGDVMALAGGGFVATWRTTDTAADGSDFAVIARIFDAGGNGGPEFLVNTATTGFQYGPRLAALPDGGFITVWYTSDVAQDGSVGAIKAQLFNAAGGRVGGEFLVNTQAANDQFEPVVAARSDGSFAIVWFTRDTLQDGSGTAIKGQNFDAAGQPVGEEFLVNSLATGGQSLPEVAALADGTLAVVWASDSGDGSGLAIRGRLFEQEADAAASPVIDSNGGGDSASIEVAEGISVVTTVSATDADSAVVTFAIAGGDDAALFTLDSATGMLAFAAAPDFEAPADADGDNVYEVTVTASDGLLSDTQTLAITVGNLNETPQITSGGGNDAATLAVDENGRSVAIVTANDPDGQPLAYAIAGGADASRFAINPGTGELAFVAAPDFETPADADGDNVYEVTVAAGDGLLADTQTLAITVGNLNETPRITSGGGNDAAVLAVDENSRSVTIVNANDPDGQPLAYAIAGGADAARFTIDAGTGELAFVAAPNFEAPADADGDNVYEVTVSAGDGLLADSQTLAITVRNLDEAPRITSDGGGDTANLSVAENSRLVTIVTAENSAGQPLKYAIAGGADAAQFAIDSATGKLSFVKAPNFEAPKDVGRDNVYEVVVTASNGVQSDAQTLRVSVENLVDGVTRGGNNDMNLLIGTVAEDTLLGRGGSDALYGAAGNDRLDGGVGADVLVGGRGADTITGGKGADLFMLQNLADSLPDAPDIFTDFSRSAHDRIFLKGIDANLLVSGNQDFRFIGTAAFSGRAGQLRYEHTDGNTLVMGDVNGDGVADFAVQVTGLVVLGSADFVL